MSDKAAQGQGYPPASLKSAAFVNHLVDIVEAHKYGAERPGPTKAGHFSSDRIKLRNSSGGNLARGSVLQLGELLLDQMDPLNLWFDADTVAEPVEQRYAILVEPIPSEKIGVAQVSGVCIARVNVINEDHRFAVPVAGQTYLNSAESGPIELLSPPDGETEQEMIVRIGVGSDSESVEYVLTHCTDSEKWIDRYVKNDLSYEADNDLIVKEANGQCYRVRLRNEEEDPECTAAVCVVIVATYPSCPNCNAQWKLTECAGGASTVLYTNQDLAEYDGRIVELDNGTCYTVSISDPKVLGTQTVTIVSAQEACGKCNYCYTLVRCGDETEPPESIEVKCDLRYLFNGPLGTATAAEMITAGAVFRRLGECWKVTGYDECDSENPSACAGMVYIGNDCDLCGCVMLTECTAESPEVIYAYRALNSEAEPFDLREYLGQVARLADGKCYRISEADDPATQCGIGTSNEVTVLEVYTDCVPAAEDTESECACCNLWELTECAESMPDVIVTYSDMVGHGYAVGDFVKRDDDDTCWQITSDTPTWTGAEVLFTPKAPPKKYYSCDGCNLLIKYELTNSCDTCSDKDDSQNTSYTPVVTDPIITTTDLADAVGKWVKYQGKCWVVSTATGSAVVTNAHIAYQGPYDSCELCQLAEYRGKVPPGIEFKKGTGDEFILVMNTLVVGEGGHVVGVCVEEISIAGTECEEV